MTAQETSHTMLREDVAPALRRLGFNGSGQAYTLPSETHWSTVGFEKSTSSHADCVRFTVNLSVVRKDEWDAAYEEMPFIGRRPSANTRAPVAAAWYERIGLLMPKRSDVWWELHAGGHREHIAGEVVAAIRDHALPALRERMT